MSEELDKDEVAPSEATPADETAETSDEDPGEDEGEELEPEPLDESVDQSDNSVAEPEL